MSDFTLQPASLEMQHMRESGKFPTTLTTPKPTTASKHGRSRRIMDARSAKAITKPSHSSGGMSIHQRLFGPAPEAEPKFKWEHEKRWHDFMMGVQQAAKEQSAKKANAKALAHAAEVAAEGSQRSKRRVQWVVAPTRKAPKANKQTRTRSRLVKKKAKKANPWLQTIVQVNANAKETAAYFADLAVEAERRACKARGQKLSPKRQRVTSAAAKAKRKAAKAAHKKRRRALKRRAASKKKPAPQEKAAPKKPAPKPRKGPAAAGTRAPAAKAPKGRKTGAKVPKVGGTEPTLAPGKQSTTGTSARASLPLQRPSLVIKLKVRVPTGPEAQGAAAVAPAGRRSARLAAVVEAGFDEVAGGAAPPRPPSQSKSRATTPAAKGTPAASAKRAAPKAAGRKRRLAQEEGDVVEVQAQPDSAAGSSGSKDKGNGPSSGAMPARKKQKTGAVESVEASKPNTRKRKLDQAREKGSDDGDAQGTEQAEDVEGGDKSGSASPDAEPATKKQKQRAYHFAVTCVHSRCPTPNDCINPRSCILDYFGRNKAATNKLLRWPMMCRKCYQRASYKRNQWPRDKAEMIQKSLAMFAVDEAEVDPTREILYTVGLRSGEQQRLDKAKAMGVQAYIDAAKAAGDNKKHPDYDPYADEDMADDAEVSVKSKSKKEAELKTVTKDEINHPRFNRPAGQTYHKMPVRVLEELMDQFGGEHRTREEVEDCVDWCLEQFESGRIPDLPRFEATNEIDWREQIVSRGGAKTEEPEDGEEEGGQEDAEE